MWSRRSWGPTDRRLSAPRRGPLAREQALSEFLKQRGSGGAVPHSTAETETETETEPSHSVSPTPPQALGGGLIKAEVVMRFDETGRTSFCGRRFLRK